MIEPLVAPPPASPASATRTTDWRALGAAIREVELLTDLAREAHYGRIRVPLDELERANVDTTTLAKPPWPDAVTEQLRARHESLRNNISSILFDVDREQQPALRGLLVWAALTWRSSQRAERALPDRLRPGRFDAISDAWFAWRIARRATIGRFRLN
jgi:phytoene/squalene synthetase